MFGGNSFLGLHYSIWAAISSVIAVVYYFVWPKPVNNINSRPRWRHIILRYFHSLVWVLIALSFLIRLAFPGPGETIGDIVALLGFVIYLIFIATATIDRRAPD